jgi:hypothetical protein
MGNRIEASEAAKTEKPEALQPQGDLSAECGQLNSNVESRD